MEQPKKKRKMKTWAKVLLIVGIVLTVLILALVGAAAYLLSQFRSPVVEIGELDNGTVAHTAYGDVAGYLTDGIYTYHGIPYAEATERFVPAVKPTPWTGVFDATNYGAASPQGAILGGAASTSDNGSNNCQNLNLWTPALDNGKRPVLVWLHGGGFSSGSANDAQYDGANLARFGDVVVVGVNHRLNVYGHLDLSAYGEKYRYSANVGVDDIILALEWLQENVASFGGDPENITVFGQSGGGAKVLALMTSQRAKGKFQKGIVQSGATETLGNAFASAEVSQSITAHLLENLNITADNIEAIQSVSNADLQSAATRALQAAAEEYRLPQALGMGYATEWGPVVDGDFMPSSPVTETGFADAGYSVPMLIGSNLNEWAIMGGQTHAAGDELTAAFTEAYPNENAADAANVDTLLRLPILRITAHKADQGGAPVYSYVFTYQAGFMGSYHGAEIPFVFHSDNSRLSDTMASLWVSFARDGVPSADGLPAWEPYTRDGGAVMILDNESYLAHHHDEKLLKLLAPDYIW